MVVIQAKKTILNCPETDQEVVMQEDCLNPKGDGESCVFFKHFGIRGNHIWVSCKSLKLQHLTGRQQIARARQ